MLFFLVEDEILPSYIWINPKAEFSKLSKLEKNLLFFDISQSAFFPRS